MGIAAAGTGAGPDLVSSAGVADVLGCGLGSNCEPARGETCEPGDGGDSHFLDGVVDSTVRAPAQDQADDDDGGDGGD